MDPSSKLREAILLAEDGKKGQARRLISGILQYEPWNADAWIAMSQVVDKHDEAVECLHKALRIRPGDETAQRYLSYLEGQDGSDRERIPPFVIVGGVAALVMLCLVGLIVTGRLPLRQAAPSPAAAVPSPTSAVNCRELIDQALEISDESCQTVDRDQLCYGHTTVVASLLPGRTGRFQETGDVLPIDSLTRLSAAPLDLDTENWGVGIFKLQANLPYTLPGQLVTMIVAGNTSLQNPSHTMQVFTFSSGIGGLNCESAPVDGLVVRMPDGAGIRFNVNGSELALTGDALLQAEAGDQLQVTMIDGAGWISSDGVAKPFGAGETASVPLEGLTANGPPSLGPSAAGNLCMLAGTCDSPQPTPQGPPDQLIAMLETAVGQATLTLQPSLTPVADAVEAGSGAPAVTATARSRRPTSTPRSRTSTPVLTATPTKTPTPGSTAEQIAQESTKKPTKTPKPATEPPTESPTEQPTETLTEQPTEQPTEPVTEPPPAASCDKITAGWRRLDGQTAQFKFANGNNVDINLTSFSISWDSASGTLIRVAFRGELKGLALPVVPPPPPERGSFNASVSGSEAVLKANSPITDLQFKFDRKPKETGYSVTATFDVGGSCVKIINH